MTLLAVDTETEGVAYYDRPFLVSAAWEDQSVAYDLDIPGESQKATDLLAAHDVWVMHNSKFDLAKLILGGIIRREDVTPERFEDTEALAHLLDEHRRKGLKPLTRELLGIETDEEEVLKKVRREMKLKKSDGYHILPRDVLIPYALKDAEFTLALYHKLRPQLDRFDDLAELYQMEKEVTLVLLDMEARGMALDMEYVDRTTKEYALQAVKTEMDIRDLTGDEDFNPNSPKQILEAFGAMGIPLDKTDRETLSGVDHPLAQDILNLRSTRKMHGTYLTSIQDEQREGIIHPWFRQHNTRTGRFASGEAEN